VCSKGDACEFLHQQPKETKKTEKKDCVEFMRSGECHRGGDCPDMHNTSPSVLRRAGRKGTGPEKLSQRGPASVALASTYHDLNS